VSSAGGGAGFLFNDQSFSSDIGSKKLRITEDKLNKGQGGALERRGTFPASEARRGERIEPSNARQDLEWFQLCAEDEISTSLRLWLPDRGGLLLNSARATRLYRESGVTNGERGR